MYLSIEVSGVQNKISKHQMLLMYHYIWFGLSIDDYSECVYKSVLW